MLMYLSNFGIQVLGAVFAAPTWSMPVEVLQDLQQSDHAFVFLFPHWRRNNALKIFE